jgi:hypothetical protein
MGPLVSWDSYWIMSVTIGDSEDCATQSLLDQG